MNVSNTSNLLGISFAGILLLLVLFPQVENTKLEKPAFDSRVQDTVLVAARKERHEIELTNSSVALVKELDAAREALAFNAEQRWPLASLTKLMTAVAALEELSPGQEIIVSENAVLAEGDAGNFKPGEVFSVRDLTKAMMSVSSNDAATALAEFYGIENFVAAMREKARSLQMNQTTFFDPAGLSLANQSTVYDLERLVSYVFSRHPEILTWSALKSLEITELKSKLKRTLVNINQFAGQKDFIGGKTGYLDEASGNLVSLFRHRDKAILIVSLGSENRFADTLTLYQWFKEKYGNTASY